MKCTGTVLGAPKRHITFVWMWMLFVFSFVFNSHGLPANRPKKPPITDEKVHNYLARFGYLSKSCSTENGKPGCLMMDDELIAAIKNFQAFGNIPVTGEIDKETEKLLRTPRCGIPDISSPGDNITGASRSKRYAYNGYRWTHNNLTWSLESRQIKQLDYYAVENVLERALNLWSSYANLTFKKLHSKDADILIYFERNEHGDGNSFDGQGRVLAHAFAPGPNLGGDAHFDLDEEWSVENNGDRSRGTNLLFVAVHEFGHSLGLSHSSVYGSYMYPYYQDSLSEDMPDDDRDAIQSLYGRKDNRQNTPGDGRRPTPRPMTPSTPRDPVYRPYYPDRTPYNPESPPYNPDNPAYNPGRPPYHPERPPYIPERPPYTPERPSYHPERPSPKPENPPYHSRPPYNPERPHPERPTNPTNRPNYPARPSNPYRPSTPSRPYNPRYPHYPDAPDTCDTSYDAISILRNELFVFKDRYMWRMSDRGIIQNGFPCPITQIWSQLPSNFTHVDAVYERYNGDIIFFIGRDVYTFKGQYLASRTPKQLTSFGLPSWVDHIDAVVIWGYNSKTYLYSGSLYWRFDEEIQKVDLDYPRNISYWRGIGSNIDAAFKWKDGATYFFKGKGFWKFNDSNVTVVDKHRTPSAEFWMGCKNGPENQSIVDDEDNEDNEAEAVAAAPSFLSVNLLEIIIISVTASVIVIVAVVISIRRSKSHSYIQPKRFKI